MLKEVDCRGLECPRPVILTRQALESLEKGTVVALVDNTIARDNVIRMMQGLKLDATVQEKAGEYQITINKEGSSASAEVFCGVAMEEVKDDWVLLLSADVMGRGNDELGKILVKSLLYTVANKDIPPKAVVMLNTGVKLACKDSLVLDSLEAIAARGVDIVSCGTCLEFFKLKEFLAIGRIGNMYDIVEILAAHRVVNA